MKAFTDDEIGRIQNWFDNKPPGELHESRTIRDELFPDTSPVAFGKMLKNEFPEGGGGRILRVTHIPPADPSDNHQRYRSEGCN